MTKSKLYIPEDAKCVFKWKVYETWQREQEMYDWTVKTFEKVKKPNTATVFAVVENKIVVQRQEQPHRDPFISLPWGKCEEWEDPIQSAERELLEETGLVCEEIFLRKTIPSSYSSVVRESHYFIAKWCKQNTDLNLDGWELIENRFMNFDEFLMLSENDNFRDNDLINVLLKMRLNSKLKTDFYTKLFW